MFTAAASIQLSASASDATGTVVKVDFYAGSALVGTATTSPYTCTWLGLAPGSYLLTARATDNAGLVGVSAPVSITVQAEAGGGGNAGGGGGSGGSCGSGGALSLLVGILAISSLRRQQSGSRKQRT